MKLIRNILIILAIVFSHQSFAMSQMLTRDNCIKLGMIGAHLYAAKLALTFPLIYAYNNIVGDHYDALPDAPENVTQYVRKVLDEAGIHNPNSFAVKYKLREPYGSAYYAISGKTILITADDITDLNEDQKKFVNNPSLASELEHFLTQKEREDNDDNIEPHIKAHTFLLKHEANHIKHNEQYRRTAVSLVAPIASYCLTKLIGKTFNKPNNPLLQCLLIATSGALQGVCSQLIIHRFSRYVEQQADQYTDSCVDELDAAHWKLADTYTNELYLKKKHPLAWLFESHPPLLERIQHLEQRIYTIIKAEDGQEQAQIVLGKLQSRYLLK